MLQEHSVTVRFLRAALATQILKPLFCVCVPRREFLSYNGHSVLFFAPSLNQASLQNIKSLIQAQVLSVCLRER